MLTKDLIDLAGDPNLIPGIYNYCDRWCERCPFSSRCLVYRTEQEDDDGDPASRDITNAAFWKKLTDIFKQTREMITAWAEESGVDLSDISDEEIASAMEQKKAEMKDATEHPLSKAALGYAQRVSEWFDQTPPILETISDSPDAAEDSTAEENSDELEAAEVIRWYQFFIGVKIARALMSQVDEDEEGDEYPKDSDGSAKVALIAIDRSISAWRLMTEVRSDRADSIRHFLFELEKLRLGAEREFPGARDFMRPGFDEVGLGMVN